MGTESASDDETDAEPSANAYDLMAAPRLALATIAYAALAVYAMQSSNLVQFVIVAIALLLVSLYWGWDAWNYEKARAALTNA
jgi:hypothetical protein